MAQVCELLLDNVSHMDDKGYVKWFLSHRSTFNTELIDIILSQMIHRHFICWHVYLCLTFMIFSHYFSFTLFRKEVLADAFSSLLYKPNHIPLKQNLIKVQLVKNKT